MEEHSRPESDYATWDCLFKATIEPGGMYTSFTDECMELIFQVVESGSLADPISEYTDQFISDTLPTVIKQLLNLMYLEESERETIICLLNCAYMLIIWGFANDKPCLMHLALQIIDNRQPFYLQYVMHGGTSVGYWYNTVLDQYRDSVACMIERLKQNNPRASTHHFVCFYMIVSYVTDVDIDPVIESLECLSEWLNTEKEIRGQGSSITGIFQSLFSFCQISGIDTDKISEHLVKIFSFIDACVHSPIFDIQMIGINGLESVIMSRCVSVINLLVKFASECDLLEHIVDKISNYQLIDKVRLLYRETAIAGKMNDTLVEKIWETSKHAQPNENELWCLILAGCLEYCSCAVGFLGRIAKDENLMMNFKMLNFLMARFKRRNNPKIFAALMEILMDHVSDKRVLDLLDEYSDVFGLNFNIMPTMNALARAIRNRDNVPFFLKIPDFVSNFTIGEDIPDLLKVFEGKGLNIITSIATNSCHTFTKEEMSDIFSLYPRNDDMARFLESILSSNGTLSMDEEAVKVTEAYLSAISDDDLTEMFVETIFTFILLVNFKRGCLVAITQDEYHKIPSRYRLRNANIYGVDMLCKVYEMATDPVAIELARKNIMKIFHSILLTTNETIGYFWDFIKRNLYEKDITEKALCRMLDILYYTLLDDDAEIVVENWEYSRMMDTNARDVIEIMLIIEDVIAQPFKIYSDMMLKQLMTLLAYKYGISGHEYDIKVEDMVLDDNDYIEEGSLVTLTRKAETTKLELKEITPLVVRVTREQVQNDLIKWLKYEEAGKYAMKLLQILPLVPEPQKPALDILTLIGASENKYEMKYWLARLKCAMKSDDFVRDFNEQDGMAYLTKCMETSGRNFVHFSKLITALDKSYLVRFIARIVPFCLETFMLYESDKIYRYCSDLLSACCRADEDEFCDALSARTDVLEKLLLKSQVCAAHVTTYLSKIRNPGIVLEHLITLLCDNEIHEDAEKSVFLAIKRLIPKVDEDMDLSVMKRKCRELIRTTKDDRLSHLIGIVSELPYEDDGLVEELLERVMTSSGVSLSSLLRWVKKNKIFIDPLIDNYIDQCYSSKSQVVHAVNGMIGLRNLGATCYMNAVLQQIFSIKPFVTELLKKESEEEWMIELQKLFQCMTNQEQEFADTHPFTKVWKGWDKRPINPGEQQDANEFFQLLIDQMPEDIKSIFKGQIVNIIEGIHDDYRSENTEDFLSLGMSVLGLKSIDESMDHFAKSISFLGDNKIMAESLGKKIEAKKYSRISKPPQVLVCMLKRFEYDLTNYERYKVNDYYSFPSTLNIKTLMKDSEDVIYRLHGIVLHQGYAHGGHYSSLVRNGEVWASLNDSHVTHWDPVNLDYDTFGGSEKRHNAYMLFYERVEKEEEVDEVQITDESSPESKEATKLNNIRKHLKTVVLSEFIRTRARPSTMVKYLFEISMFEIQRREKFVASIEDTLNDMHEERALYEYIIENWRKVVDLAHGNDSQFLESRISWLCRYISDDEKMRLAECFIIGCDVLVAHYQYAISTAYIPAVILTENIGVRNRARSRRWAEYLIFVVQEFYSRARSYDMCSIDLSNVFICIQYSFGDEDQEAILQLFSLLDLLMKSNYHRTHLESMLRTFRFIPADVIRTIMTSSGFEPRTKSVLFRNWIESEEYEDIARYARDNIEEYSRLISCETRGLMDERTLSILIKNYRELVYPLVVHPNMKISNKGVSITYHLLNEIAMNDISDILTLIDTQLSILSEEVSQYEVNDIVAPIENLMQMLECCESLDRDRYLYPVVEIYKRLTKYSNVMSSMLDLIKCFSFEAIADVYVTVFNISITLCDRYIPRFHDALLGITADLPEDITIQAMNTEDFKKFFVMMVQSEKKLPSAILDCLTLLEQVDEDIPKLVSTLYAPYMDDLTDRHLSLGSVLLEFVDEACVMTEVRNIFKWIHTSIKSSKHYKFISKLCCAIRKLESVDFSELDYEEDLMSLCDFQCDPDLCSYAPISGVSQVLREIASVCPVFRDSLIATLERMFELGICFIGFLFDLASSCKEMDHFIQIMMDKETSIVQITGWVMNKLMHACMVTKSTKVAEFVLSPYNVMLISEKDRWLVETIVLVEETDRLMDIVNRLISIANDTAGAANTGPVLCLLWIHNYPHITDELSELIQQYITGRIKPEVKSLLDTLAREQTCTHVL